MEQIGGYLSWMAWYIPVVTVGVLIELKCPHCHKLQLRARKAKGVDYICKFCHTVFKREEGKKHKGFLGR